MLQLGNYLGAVKNAANVAKNKTFRRKIIIKTAIPILTPILLVVIIASAIFGIFDAVGDRVQSVFDSITDFFDFNLESIDNPLAIEIKPETLDAMIESIESTGVSLDDLHLMGDAADYNDPEVKEKNQEALRKYIKQFYEAQAVTQTLNPNPAFYQNLGDKTYGTVYVQRTKEEDKNLSKVTQLAYIAYDKMLEKQTKANNVGDSTEVHIDNFLFIGDSRTATAKSQLADLGKNNNIAGVDLSKPNDWKEITTKGGTGTVLNTTVTLTPTSLVKGVSVALGVNGTSYQIEHMKKVLDNLLALYPDVPIFVNEVVKVGKNYNDRRLTASEVNTQIITFNSQLKQYCDTNSRLIYINVSSELYDSEGYLKSEYTTDALQLNEKGNKVLVENIKNAMLDSGAIKEENKEQAKPSEHQIEDIMKYFSINPDTGKLVVANTTTTKTKIVETGEIIQDEIVIGLTEIDYKSVISQYTTSMNFLVYLTIITQNPEFAAAVADLIKDSDIRITIMDKVTNTVTTEENSYTLHKKWIEEVEHVSYDNWDTNKEYPHTSYTYEERTSKQNKTDTTETTIISTIPVPAVNYAKTWFSEQTIEYVKEDTPIQSGPNSTEPYDEDEPPISRGDDEVTWKTNNVTTITTTGNTSQYKEVKRGEVIDRLGERGDGKKSFVGLLDVKFRIPNQTRGVLGKESAGFNLVSGADMLFHLLQKDPNSQNLENILRYALYKYTGKSYGVTKLDLSMFDISDFSNFSGGVVGNSVEEKVWYSLRNMGLSEYAVAGVMGNIYGESGFRPDAIEGGSGEGHGLCQWSYGRRENLERYAESKGQTWDNVNIQVQYLMGELTEGGGANGFATYNLLNNKGYTVDGWKNATSASEAAVEFCYIFERPSKPRLEVRKEAAERYYNEFKGKELTYPADSISSGGYTFSHYLQRNYTHIYGTSTISNAGCGPTSLAMVLSGILSNPTITPITVVENMEEYYPSYKSYYMDDVGTIWGGMLNNDLLNKYYGVKATYVSTEQGIQAVENGKVAIGRVKGHILAIVPVPDEYKGQGYRFYIMDSARGLDGPYRNAEEVKKKSKSGGVFSIKYIIEPN